MLTPVLWRRQVGLFLSQTYDPEPVCVWGNDMGISLLQGKGLNAAESQGIPLLLSPTSQGGRRH